MYRLRFSGRCVLFLQCFCGREHRFPEMEPLQRCRIITSCRRTSHAGRARIAGDERRGGRRAWMPSRDQVLNRDVDVAGIAASSRERLDPLRAASPSSRSSRARSGTATAPVCGQLRQTLTQRGDERPARPVEVLGHELRQERRVLGGQHGAQPPGLFCPSPAAESRRARPDKGVDHRLELAGRHAAPRPNSRTRSALSVAAMTTVDLRSSPSLPRK